MFASIKGISSKVLHTFRVFGFTGAAVPYLASEDSYVLDFQEVSQVEVNYYTSREEETDQEEYSFVLYLLLAVLLYFEPLQTNSMSCKL